MKRWLGTVPNVRWYREVTTRSLSGTVAQRPDLVILSSYCSGSSSNDDDDTGFAQTRVVVLL